MSNGDRVWSTRDACVSHEAREAVARVLCNLNDLADWDAQDEGIREMWRQDADAVLDAIRPFTAAAVRLYTHGEIEVYQPDTRTCTALTQERTAGRLAQLRELVDAADDIAAHVCGWPQ